MEPLHSVGSSSQVDQRIIGWESSDGWDFLQSWRSRSTVWIAIGPSIVFDASSDGPDASWKNTTIAIRSNRDRRIIEPRSWSVRCGINSTIVRHCFREDLQRDGRPIDPRSGHDCGRSWSIAAKIMARKKWKSWQN